MVETAPNREIITALQENSKENNMDDFETAREGKEAEENYFCNESGQVCKTGNEKSELLQIIE